MSPSHQQLLSAAELLFLDLSTNTPCKVLATHFSSTKDVVIQNAPKLCPHPHTSRLSGLNAVRSHFDLLAMYWIRSDAKINERNVVGSHRVVISASTKWTWRLSGRSWTEEFLCMLDYDDNLKIIGMIVETTSAPWTCVARAIESGSSDS
ncbi:hypothetical protein B0H14DRAFT_2422985 [Mycena olivaceomarginata]|nr:hypothetical protein B0H14DRAFT_2422985 [Mycena olivaceomarginata]